MVANLKLMASTTEEHLLVAVEIISAVEIILAVEIIPAVEIISKSTTRSTVARAYFSGG